MTFQIMGTEHLKARCVCKVSTKGRDGCPLHQVPVRIVPSIASTVSEIDALRAENSALRDELETLQQTHVGEVVAHNEELFAERNQLLGRVRALESEVSRLGGGVL